MTASKEQFNSLGYHIERALFDKSEIQDILSASKDIFEFQFRRYGIRVPTKADEAGWLVAMRELFELDFLTFSNCGKHAQHLVELHRLSLDNRILDLSKNLGITYPNICTRPVLYFNHRDLAKEEVYWKVLAHQDWRSMQGSLNAQVVWLPLVDIPNELGALQVIPGSHHLGLLTDRVVSGFGAVDSFKDSDFISVPLNQGDALFFSSLLVHRSGSNDVDRIRWSCHFRYNDMNESTFVERGFPSPYVYKPADALITPNFPQLEEIEKVYPSLKSTRRIEN